MVFDLESRAYPDPAPLVEGETELGDDRVGLDARRPYEEPGLELGAVAECDPAVDDLFEPGAEPYVNTSLDEQVVGVLTSAERGFRPGFLGAWSTSTHRCGTSRRFGW